MATDLASLAENTIDAAIRSFYSGGRNNYIFWDSELQHLEALLSKADATPELQHLLASVRAQRVALAFEVSKHDLVLELTAQFICDVPVDHPSFSLVASLRASSLHSVGAHEEEAREVLELARKPGLQGSEYIFLLEHLAKRHSGSIPQDHELVDKTHKAIAALRTLGYQTFPREGTETGLEQLVLETASEIRRVNREKAETLLGE